MAALSAQHGLHGAHHDLARHVRAHGGETDAFQQDEAQHAALHLLVACHRVQDGGGVHARRDQRQSVGAQQIGLPVDLYQPCSGEGAEEPYLVFLGRFSRDKRPDRAIEIARRAGLKLKLAAKIGDDDRPYFRETVEPLIDGDRIDYVGEIDEAEKAAFLGNAAGLVFPIDWPEPFGLVVIEAMAFGTPVLAWNCGAMPEIVDPGITGFLAESIEDAVASVPDLLALDRRRVRRTFEARFSATRMARDYLAAYARLLGAGAEVEAS